MAPTWNREYGTSLGVGYGRAVSHNAQSATDAILRAGGRSRFVVKCPTFVGVIVAVCTDVTGAMPKQGDLVVVSGSQKLSILAVARMLAQATEKVIGRLMTDDQRAFRPE